MSVRKPARVGALLIGVLLAAGFALGAFVHQLRSVRNSAPNDFAIVSKISTPADVRIQTAQRVVEQHPNQPESYNLLASAFMQKARETNDFGFNARAEAALGRSLEVAPDNYDALKLRASLLLTHHRFAEALDLAQRLKTIRSDDHDVYGLLTDAQVELGDYPAAIQAAQQMVNLRPDSSSYARVSYLRSLHGDGEGAIEGDDRSRKGYGPKRSRRRRLVPSSPWRRINEFGKTHPGRAGIRQSAARLSRVSIGPRR
jgi:tetratricopeptide (TPR) repeat protein